ncbi:MAG: hypothetical protein U1E87_06165 [Alphaproteobacteria bacterium]
MTISYEVPGLSLTDQGRALEPGAIGDTISVLNPGSHKGALRDRGFARPRAPRAGRPLGPQHRGPLREMVMAYTDHLGVDNSGATSPPPARGGGNI